MPGGRVIIVFGEQVEIVLSSEATGYTACVGIQTSPPGGGPPPHMHQREEEFFQVLEGSFELFDGTTWKPLPKGQVGFSPRGHWHAFRNSGPREGRIMFWTNGGGLDEYLAQISALTLPDDLDRLMEVSRHYGYVYQPPGATDAAPQATA